MALVSVQQTMFDIHSIVQLSVPVNIKMYGRRFFCEFMQIHAFWLVRKDGASAAWNDAEAA